MQTKYMEPKHQSSPPDNQTANREQIPNSRKAALEKCRTACEEEDLDEFKSQIQEFYGLLFDDNVRMLLSYTISKGWFEGA
jgi:hypothetical protein